MNILSIGGSDPSSGAGIQGDIKTFSYLGAYGFTVLTSVTSQNTKKFQKAEPVSPKMIKTQIESIFSDFKVDAIKIGMVYNCENIKVIYSKLKKVKVPIIVDPVLESTTGGILLKKNALKCFKKYLIPLASAITPNVSEAEILAGRRVSKKEDLKKIAEKIRSLGAQNVIITGFKTNKNTITDFVLEDSKQYFVKGKRIPRTNHGGGCIFSASLTVEIAKRKRVLESVKFAKKMSYKAIRNSIKIGKGESISNILGTRDKQRKILEKSVNDFVNLKECNRLIPEVQTNFVYSKPNPKSIRDVLGIDGRIVRAGKKTLVAGELKYGGSHHVASAVIEISKKFPKMRSAINIKYEPKLVEKMKKMKFLISQYDRKKEPAKIKQKENASISWGIKNAIKNKKTSPDAIYHKGDLGKEPMILIFGDNPHEVLEKVSKIL